MNYLISYSHVRNDGPWKALFAFPSSPLRRVKLRLGAACSLFCWTDRWKWPTRITLERRGFRKQLRSSCRQLGTYR
jgi:hypothetical protein